MNICLVKNARERQKLRKKGNSLMLKNGSVPEKGVFWSVSKLLVKQNTEITHENFV